MSRRIAVFKGSDGLWCIYLPDGCAWPASSWTQAISAADTYIRLNLLEAP